MVVSGGKMLSCIRIGPCTVLFIGEVTSLELVVCLCDLADCVSLNLSGVRSYVGTLISTARLSGQDSIYRLQLFIIQK